jgi:hypothetical protein
MKRESKPKLGKWRNNRLYSSDTEKRLIGEDYLSGSETKQSVYRRYRGCPAGNGKITMWMRKLGMGDKVVRYTNFEAMAKRKKGHRSCI